MYKIAQYEYGTRCRCCNGEMLMCEPDLFPNFMQLREPDTGREIQFGRGEWMAIQKLSYNGKSFMPDLTLEIFVPYSKKKDAFKEYV